MKKAKIILLVFLGLSVLVFGMLGIWVVMTVWENHEVMSYGRSLAETVPVEEVWESKEVGQEISLGYMSIWLDPNEIESVEIDTELMQSISLKDGLNFQFTLPFEEETVAGILKHPYYNVNTLQEAEEYFNQRVRFEGQVEGYKMQPKTNLEYVWMDKKERDLYLYYMSEKLNGYSDKGIVIFDAGDIVGIYLRGSKDDTMSFVTIYGKDLKRWQLIWVESRIGVTEPGEEAKIKRILGSMRYLVEELPGEGELEAMVAEAVGAIVVK